MSLAITSTTLNFTHAQNGAAQLAASGATGGLNWEIVQGRLPDGLQLNAGRVVGLCYPPGTASVTVRCTDLGTGLTPVAFAEAQVSVVVT